SCQMLTRLRQPSRDQANMPLRRWERGVFALWIEFPPKLSQNRSQTADLLAVAERVTYRMSFRGLTTTAPLKPSPQPLCRYRISWFPWSHDHGPIEAALRSFCSARTYLVSVVSRPRPH